MTRATVWLVAAIVTGTMMSVACNESEDPVGGMGGAPGPSRGNGGMPGASTCGASTCNGCCRGNVCEPGDALAACGGGGVACAVCPANALCTTARTCAANVDLESLWRVQPVSTTVAARPTTGQWDEGEDTTPDVMVLIDCKAGGLPVSGAAESAMFEVDARTDASSSLSPMWSTLGFGTCDISARSLLAAPIKFRVFDDDSGIGLVGEKDAISTVQTYQVTAADLAAGTFSLPMTGLLAGPLVVNLVRQP